MPLSPPSLALILAERNRPDPSRSDFAGCFAQSKGICSLVIKSAGRGGALSDQHDPLSRRTILMSTLWRSGIVPIPHALTIAQLSLTSSKPKDLQLRSEPARNGVTDEARKAKRGFKPAEDAFRSLNRDEKTLISCGKIFNVS